MRYVYTAGLAVFSLLLVMCVSGCEQDTPQGAGPPPGPVAPQQGTPQTPPTDPATPPAPQPRPE